MVEEAAILMIVAEDEGYKGSGLEQAKHPGCNGCNRDAVYENIFK